MIFSKNKDRKPFRFSGRLFIVSRCEIQDLSNRMRVVFRNVAIEHPLQTGIYKKQVIVIS